MDMRSFGKHRAVASQDEKTKWSEICIKLLILNIMHSAKQVIFFDKTYIIVRSVQIKLHDLD